jgi:hypothetical protein
MALLWIIATREYGIAIMATSSPSIEIYIATYGLLVVNLDGRCGHE